MIGLILSRECRLELGAESQTLDLHLDPEPGQCIILLILEILSNLKDYVHLYFSCLCLSLCTID